MGVSKQSIVTAALEILDSYGLADLSMRRIGEALGVQAATIYWYYANKQSLLAGVSDRILAAQASSTAGPLAAALTAWAEDLRGVLLRHRDAAELVAATLAVGLGERVPDETAVEILRAAGWDESAARAAARAITHFVLGHVMQEQTRHNLLELGVLAAPVVAVDQAGFDIGLQMVVAGAQVSRP